MLRTRRRSNFDEEERPKIFRAKKKDELPEWRSHSYVPSGDKRSKERKDEVKAKHKKRMVKWRDPPSMPNEKTKKEEPSPRTIQESINEVSSSSPQWINTYCFKKNDIGGGQGKRTHGKGTNFEKLTKGKEQARDKSPSRVVQTEFEKVYIPHPYKINSFSSQKHKARWARGSQDPTLGNSTKEEEEKEKEIAARRDELGDDFDKILGIMKRLSLIFSNGVPYKGDSTSKLEK